jgi:hypothetical protein
MKTNDTYLDDSYNYTLENLLISLKNSLTKDQMKTELNALLFSSDYLKEFGNLFTTLDSTHLLYALYCISHEYIGIDELTDNKDKTSFFLRSMVILRQNYNISVSNEKINNNTTAAYNSYFSSFNYTKTLIAPLIPTVRIGTTDSYSSLENLNENIKNNLTTSEIASINNLFSLNNKLYNLVRYNIESKLNPSIFDTNISLVNYIYNYTNGLYTAEQTIIKNGSSIFMNDQDTEKELNNLNSNSYIYNKLGTEINDDTISNYQTVLKSVLTKLNKFLILA